MEEALAVNPQHEYDPLSRFLKADVVDGLVVNPNCPLCKAKNRAKAEEMYDSKVSAVNIKKFLEENGEPMALPSVNHHFDEHYKKQINLIILEEYCQNLSAMQEKRRSRLSDLEVTVNVGFIELARAISINTKGNIDAEKERSDMIMKAMRSIREGLEQINGIESAEAQVKEMHHKLLSVWRTMIEGAKNETERQALIKSLQSFKELLDAG